MRELVQIGCDHRHVPPSRLEGVSGQASELSARLIAAKANGEIAGAVLLRTCNRVELLIDGEASDRARLFTLARELLGASLPFVECAGSDVVRRMLRIATGLESMVLFEEQILGQVTRAFKSAEDDGLLSRSLHMLRTRLLSAARQLRGDLPAAGPVSSVAALGVERVLESGPRIGVLGAGETARLALDILRRRGRSATVVINRTLSKAESLATHFGCEATSLDEFLADPMPLDALICAIDARGPVINPKHVEGAQLVVDLSRPSICAPETRAIPTLEVVDLDGLAERARAESDAQREAAEVVSVQIEARTEQLWDQIAPGRAYLGSVVDLHVESALAEVEQALRGKLEHLEQNDQDSVRELARRLAKRHAHYHILDLKQLGAK